MAAEISIAETQPCTAARNSGSDFRESIPLQLQYGIGLAIQKGLPFLLIPVLVAYYGEHAYSAYVLFCASGLMFVNLMSLAVPNAVIPFWYAEPDKRTLAWTLLLLMLFTQVALSGGMGIALWFIYKHSFGAAAGLRLTFLGMALVFLTNFNLFLTGVCRARQLAGRFLAAQVLAGVAWIGGVALFRQRQQLEVLISLFIVFLLCQVVCMTSSISEFVWLPPHHFDWGLARRILSFSLPLLPHVEATAFYFWVDKYAVSRSFAAPQFSGFVVTFQYAFAQSFFSAALAMHTLPLICKLVKERQGARLRSVLRTYNLVYLGLGLLWVSGVFFAQHFLLPLRINPRGFVILGAAFLLWNIASNYINVLWARFKTPAVTGVSISTGAILLVMLLIGSRFHSLTMCYLSHLGWASAALLGLLWLESRQQTPSEPAARTPEEIPYNAIEGA